MSQRANGACRIVNGQPLFSLRTALVLFIAIVAGLVGGTVAYVADPTVAKAALYATGVAVAALLLAHQLIGPDKPSE